jgi:hypothetical protein
LAYESKKNHSFKSNGTGFQEAAHFSTRRRRMEQNDQPVWKRLSYPNSKEEKLSDYVSTSPEVYSFPKNARYFLIKSTTMFDIIQSAKNDIWASTTKGNVVLNDAFKDQMTCPNGPAPVLLFFSVNGSGSICGLAQMITEVDCANKSDVWEEDIWGGIFGIKWLSSKKIFFSTLKKHDIKVT